MKGMTDDTYVTFTNLECQTKYRFILFYSTSAGVSNGVQAQVETGFEPTASKSKNRIIQLLQCDPNYFDYLKELLKSIKNNITVLFSTFIICQPDKITFFLYYKDIRALIFSQGQVQ